jgi:hypothetical protein
MLNKGISRAVKLDSTVAIAPTRAVALAVLSLALGASGCQQNSAPSPTEESTRPIEGGSSAAGAEREIWEVALMQGSRVGYSRTVLRRLNENGHGRVLIEGAMRLAIRRFGTPMTMEIRFASTETADGKLLDCESVISQSAATVVTKGHVADGQLELQTTTAGKTTRTTIPWNPDTGGFYAVQQSLLRQPMKPGERRTVRALEPGTTSISTTELVARDHESVDLLDAKRELLRIDTTTTLENQTIRGNLWADRDGEIWKTRTDMLDLQQIRVSKEEALRAAEPGGLDFAWNTAIPVDRALDRPHATKRVRYRVRLEGGNPAEAFASGPSQEVRSIDPQTAEITVIAIRPGRSKADGSSGREGKAPPASGGVADPPTADDRQPNNWIQSDHPAIVAAAKEAAGKIEDPWQAAVALERCARERIRRPGFSQAFDTAADVMQSGEGDCTEHAVLLAALARARGIPARVAIGLIYSNRSFLYHMWTEVYIDGQWIPLDATLAQGGIGAAHLKLTHSNLAGASALTCFLPVAQVIGRLRVEIVEFE